MTHILTTLECERVLTLVTQTFPSLLKDYLRCMQMYGEKDIVMSVLDTVSFLLEVDKYANYDGERSFKYLIEINQGFD